MYVVNFFQRLLPPSAVFDVFEAASLTSHLFTQMGEILPGQCTPQGPSERFSTRGSHAEYRRTTSEPCGTQNTKRHYGNYTVKYLHELKKKHINSVITREGQRNILSP